MRDPKLVFKAQLAAAALEQAWQRWRVIHGLVADPMPTISSYVGYSLEEPWGQPRVIFGLSAADAEHLVRLLNRHDCIGPVHATVAVEQGGRELSAPADGSAGPLPVPPQVPSVAAEPASAEVPVPAAWPGSAGRAPRFVRIADQLDEQDGPVFRTCASFCVTTCETSTASAFSARARRTSSGTNTCAPRFTTRISR